MDTYLILQHYWWAIISLLAGILVFMMFVQGANSLINIIGHNENERRQILNTTGSKWELTFTCLVTFGGALFASFPMFYSVSFSGAYWMWMTLLICFVVQAVAYEFQARIEQNKLKQLFRWVLIVTGYLSPFLIGTAVSTFIYGAPFSVQHSEMTNAMAPAISIWHGTWRGLEVFWTPWVNVILGLAVMFLTRSLGALYLINNTSEKTIEQRSRTTVFSNAICFVLSFVVYIILFLTKDGAHINTISGMVEMQAFKYWNNFLEMPVLFVIFVLGVILVLYGLVRTLFDVRFRQGIWFSGAGSVLVVTSMFLVLGYDQTAFYPSSYDLQSSLTIFNSSSSEFTLRVMSIVSLLIPFVLAYIAYCWYKLNKPSKDGNSDYHY